MTAIFQFMVAARPEVRVCDGTDVRNGWADRGLLDWNGSSRTRRLPVGKLEGIAFQGWSAPESGAPCRLSKL